VAVDDGGDAIELDVRRTGDGPVDRVPTRSRSATADRRLSLSVAHS